MSYLIDIQKANGLDADGFFGKDTLSKLKDIFGLTNEQAAHFFGQLSHETGGFNFGQESLNYDNSGLVKTFPTYFPNLDSTVGYANNAQAIANKVYANRMGNGNEASGDGYKYRGRGASMITGKELYQKFSNYIKEDCVSHPELITSKYFFESAIWFWKVYRKIFKYCDTVNPQTIRDVTKAVNGGYNGLEDRTRLTNKYYSWLIPKSI